MNKYEWLTPDFPVRLLSKRNFIIIVILLTVLMLLPWNIFTVATGRITSLSPSERPQPITAPVSGFVEKWYVIEGQHVEQGDPIADLSDNDPFLIERLEQERNAAQKALDSAELMMDTAQINLDRQRDLYKQGLSSRKEYEKAKIDFSKLAMEHAKSLAALTKAQTKLSRQQMQKVTAPQAGTITRILPTIKGQILSTGTPLAILVPNISNKAVEVWVDGNDAPFIQTGQTAQVQLEGWPAIQIPGWPSLAIGTFDAKVHILDQASSNQGRFRVLLTPEEHWPSENFIRLGAKVRAYINLSQTFVGSEIWRQMNSFPIPGQVLQDELNDILLKTEKNEGTK